MLKTYEPSISEAAGNNYLIDNDDNYDTEVEEEEYSQNDTSLWCIEDDTLFYAHGLKNHSAGKGKSVFITWNHNYLLNFVFKISNKTGTTSLTKVRLPIPVHERELEEIANMLILEMNTLLYMKSGRVYYFSSVKSMHKIEWLTGVRCMTSCPPTQFSVIRFVCTPEEKPKRILSLEVYKDVPHLGKYFNNKDVLWHSYDISIDLENIFNCDWLDESYSLLSLITDEKNITFLKELTSIGNIFRVQEKKYDLVKNQEVHIFSISGNIFILVGAINSENKLLPTNPEVSEYSIRLLNTYASNIECIHIDCERNLLIVLLHSGHIDIWYKSNQVFGAFLHHQHQVSYYLHYDFKPTKNTFYFTTTDDVIQLTIIRSNENIEKECIFQEFRKSIGGMIACTWVESLQQLICLSFNNIFYRLCFEMSETVENLNENKSKYENLNSLYALNVKRIKDLMFKAHAFNELTEQPRRLHQAIEKEFQNQQLLAMGTKHEIFKKNYQCYIEYHLDVPGNNYFDEDFVQIKIEMANNSSNLETKSIYCLIFISLKNKNSFLTILKTQILYLHISDHQQSLLLHVSPELLQKKICIIIKKNLLYGNMLPKFSLNVLSFLNQCSYYVCLNFKLILNANEKTYRYLFSYNIQHLPIFRNYLHVAENLLKEFNDFSFDGNNAIEKSYTLKHCLKMSKKMLHKVVETLNGNRFEMDFKIFYLHQYLIDLKYEESKEILQIYSKYPGAIFYAKLFLLHVIKNCSDVEIFNTDDRCLRQSIMECQNSVERLYGFMTSLHLTNVDSNNISMHLENILKVYTKLRKECYEIFR